MGRRGRDESAPSAEGMRLFSSSLAIVAAVGVSSCVAPTASQPATMPLYHPTSAWVESDPWGTRESAKDREERSRRAEVRHTKHREQETLAANRILAALESCRRVELLALNPDPRLANQEPKNTNLSEKIAGGYLINARASSRVPAEIRALANALRSGFSEARPESGECFEPRHGLLFEADGKTLMAVICFSCTQAYLCEIGKPTSNVGLVISQSPEATFDSIFAKYGLPKAP
jgi:hypothetical protein